MLIGYYIVKAEPAVLVLNKQVEDITSGAISQRMMMGGLSIGMAISVGLSMLRVLTGLPLLAVLLPGYVLALGLILCGAAHFHGHRLRLGRRGLGPHDGHLPAAPGHGRLRIPGREHADGRLRDRGHGSHDAADYDPAHRPGIPGQRRAVSAARKAAPRPPRPGEAEDEIISLDEEDVQL